MQCETILLLVTPFLNDVLLSRLLLMYMQHLVGRTDEIFQLQFIRANISQVYVLFDLTFAKLTEHE